MTAMQKLIAAGFTSEQADALLDVMTDVAAGAKKIRKATTTVAVMNNAESVLDAIQTVKERLPHGHSAHDFLDSLARDAEAYGRLTDKQFVALLKFGGSDD